MILDHDRTCEISAPNAEQSDWEQWLQRQLAPLHTALGQLLAIEREKFERKASAVELKIAQLTGAVDILRGAAPPPAAKFPNVTAWRADMIYHEREVVAFNGACYQATKETAHAPGTSDDWICIAAAGAGFRMRGTYASDEEYKHLDVVVMNGSSFVALKDAPGRCPDSGHWHLLASHGKRGQRGETGARGVMGLQGERGAAAPIIQSWLLDRARYTATPVMTDGAIGPTLELRGLFEQFHSETANSKG